MIKINRELIDLPNQFAFAAHGKDTLHVCRRAKTLDANQSSCTMATTEEERFESLVGISHFPEMEKAMSAFQAAGMNTICKYITTAPELELAPLATDTLKMVATALADAVSTDGGHDSIGKVDGSDAQKARFAESLKALRLLTSHCKDSYAAARERERSGYAPHRTGGIDTETRAKWRKEPGPQVTKMIEAAEAMYNCDMTLAKQADPSTLMSIYLDLEDGKLKVPLLRSSSAWGSLSAISTESERRSGQEGTAVLLTDTVAAEAEVPVKRIAQVLNLIEVVLECLVVAAASSTDGRLVTASAYENAGNHGIVHKGLATGAWRHHIAGVCCPCKRCLTPPRVHREALAILHVHPHGCHAPVRQPIWIDGRGQFGDAFSARVSDSMEAQFRRGGAQFGKRRCGHSPQCGLDEAKLSERISSAHRGLVPADCVTQCGYEQLAGLAAHRPDLSR